MLDLELLSENTIFIIQGFLPIGGKRGCWCDIQDKQSFSEAKLFVVDRKKEGDYPEYRIVRRTLILEIWT